MWTAHLSQQKGALWPSYSARIREVVAKRRVGQDHRLTQPAFAEINHALSVEKRRRRVHRTDIIAHHAPIIPRGFPSCCSDSGLSVNNWKQME